MPNDLESKLNIHIIPNPSIQEGTIIAVGAALRLDDPKAVALRKALGLEDNMEIRDFVVLQNPTPSL